MITTIKTVFVGTVLMLSACSASNEYCNNLVTLAQQPEVQSHLKMWVSDNLVNKKINPDRLLWGGGMIPGQYWLIADFDWQSLGFSKDAQIRVVYKDSVNQELTDIRSVFFGQMSRNGILIRMPGSDTFGVDAPKPGVYSFFQEVAPGVAVICGERD